MSILTKIIKKGRAITVPLTVREERRLKGSDNSVLRGIFGLKKNEVTGEWRRLHYEELNDLNSSPKFVRMIKIEKNEMVGT
jgi:hypothetical protein